MAHLVRTRSVRWLRDPAAADPHEVGAKAANLAIAAAAGLPVLPGFALTTGSGAGDPAWPPHGESAAEVRNAWQRIGGEDRPLVVRSSSTVEDIGSSSMAGQFQSVLGVRGWQPFLDAVATVLASAARPAAAASPMGVLVQHELEAPLGGVLFGVDPITGQADRVVVEALRGGPEALVSGTAAAQRMVLDRRGRLREVDGRHPHEARRAGHPPLLTRRQLRQLAGLARRCQEVFGRPQDVEWACDPAGRLWLLQSRPVTATAAPVPVGGPILGPGPVAETFPLPLRPLEADLWLAPMRDGISRALGRAGAADEHCLTASPVLLTVGGWAAADLELLGYVPRPHPTLRLIDPRPGARKLGAAWRVGRTRAELPSRITDLLAATDTALGEIAAPAESADADLIRILDHGRDLLAELHEAEVLSATLAGRAPAAVAAVALQRLADGRRQGLPDATLIATAPVVLALIPPRIGSPVPLPPVAAEPLRLRPPSGEPGSRELLRLRARWVQELLARTADECGRRLTERGQLDHPEAVAGLRWDDLREALTHGAAVAPQTDDPGPPLPAHFRLAVDGRVVAVGRGPGAAGAGVGAGGGRVIGTAVHDPAAVGPGAILITRTLDPRLSAVLPQLTGIVAETGSTLSHLAILCREYGVPAVVAVPDALSRFPVGCRLLVDGTSGEVALDSSDGGAP